MSGSAPTSSTRRSGPAASTSNGRAAEPGCISHDVLVDPHEPGRLVFVERWADRDALDVHFAVPESIAFARALGEMAADAPHMQILPIVPRD